MSLLNKRITFLILICLSASLSAFVLDSKVKVRKSLIRWVGTWDTFYGDLRLTTNGNQVYGDYADNGVIYGYIVTEQDGSKTLTGTFQNYAVGDEGIFKFKLNPKTNNVSRSFDGKWTWTSPTSWNT